MTRAPASQDSATTELLRSQACSQTSAVLGVTQQLNDEDKMADADHVAHAGLERKSDVRRGLSWNQESKHYLRAELRWNLDIPRSLPSESEYWHTCDGTRSVSDPRVEHLVPHPHVRYPLNSK